MRNLRTCIGIFRRCLYTPFAALRHVVGDLIAPTLGIRMPSGYPTDELGLESADGRVPWVLSASDLIRGLWMEIGVHPIRQEP